MTTTYNANDMRAIMTKVANAFIALRDGSNLVSDFNLLSSAMNIGVVRAEKVSQQAVEVFQTAQRALVDADALYGSFRFYSFTQGALIDLAKGVQGYSELLQMSTPEQMEAAGTECERRLAGGHVVKHGTIQ
jgi:hypothetical protein